MSRYRSPANAPGSDGQQVMTAQVTQDAPQRGVGMATMEGEAAGPDYEAREQGRPLLPNGVTGASPMSTRTADEIESLPYSPSVLQPREPRQAFSSEAWPARPQGQEAARTDGFPAALGWVRRLGDFLKAHTSVETLTTMTRQQIVQNPTTQGGGFVLQEQQQVQRTATPTASGGAYGFGTAPQEQNAPLFGRAAARRMEEWVQNAPLLYPQTSRPVATDDASSGSIPREVVEEEVRRQVQQALKEQQRGMQELKEENRRLRDQLTLEGGSQEEPDVIGLSTLVVEYQVVIGSLMGSQVMMRVILVLSELVKDGRPGEKRRREVLVLSYDPGSPQEALEGRPERDLLELDFEEDIFVEELVSPTFGDYEFGIGHPPGLGSAGQEAYGEVPIAHPAAAPVQGPTPPAAMAPEASAGTTAPSPLDVLITGMSQLQQVLLKQKGGEALDLELKAVNELAKLPEYTPESGATDFQDYLYLAEQQIGSLASGAAEWWQKTLSVAQKAYSEYQSLSPMKRLSVKASLTEELKEDRYKKLERKVASLMLSSLPRGVRDELVAHRVQGVHQILFRLMVVFQPGGAQDRAQLLKQLDMSESSPGPAEAVVAIRKWYRLLQRAADLNRALPDESLQVRSLSTIVKKTAESHSDFKFRMALAKTEL
eukprot:s3665_g6.t1